MHHHSFNPEILLTEKDISLIAENKVQFSLSKQAEDRINKGRAFLDEKLKIKDAVYYGINTGFGALCNTVISNEKLAELQHNLILSHACGMGEEVPSEIVRLMLILKVHSLSFGCSGISIEVVQTLINWLNKEIYPVVYEQGSLGASGDLAPLAHLSLPLLGMGEVRLNGEKMDSHKALHLCGISPLKLKAKEGLALLNGTQFMLAYAWKTSLLARKLFEQSICITAASIDAFHGRTDAYNASLHSVRPHIGQKEVAQKLNRWLTASEIQEKASKQVQDPYSFRCAPQVLGASVDALNYTINVFEVETNSVTDNPILLLEENAILSGGHFHGQPLALALDFLCISMAEAGSISERRTYQLISGKQGLPDFLVNEPGLNSGFMIAQYTAASIVSQNKQYCTPASVDTIDSSKGQEDHVSMGANAATKAFKVAKNLQSILAIEWAAAAQALYFRTLKSSPAIEKVLADYRQIQSPVLVDVYMSEVLQKSKTFWESYQLD